MSATGRACEAGVLTTRELGRGTSELGCCAPGGPKRSAALACGCCWAADLWALLVSRRKPVQNAAVGADMRAQCWAGRAGKKRAGWGERWAAGWAEKVLGFLGFGFCLF